LRAPSPRRGEGDTSSPSPRRCEGVLGPIPALRAPGPPGRGMAVRTPGARAGPILFSGRRAYSGSWARGVRVGEGGGGPEHARGGPYCRFGASDGGGGRRGGGRAGGAVRAGDPPRGPAAAGGPEAAPRVRLDGRLPVGAGQLLHPGRRGAVRPPGAGAAPAA